MFTFKEYLIEGKSPTILYHGTSSKIAKFIKDDGFKLTVGKRNSEQGKKNVVKNQAIFLSNDKKLAKSFAEKKGDDYEILKVKANIHKTLDMTEWNSDIPLDIRKFAIELVKKHEKKSEINLNQDHMFWLIDQPSFVNYLKKDGYDSVRYKESQSIRKSIGAGAGSETGGDTIAVFDPNLLHIVKVPIPNLTHFVDYLNKNR